MAILHKPGEEVVFWLPSDMGLPEEERGVAVMRVPDEATFRRLLQLKPKGTDLTEPLRVKLGAYLQRLERVTFSDGEEVEVKKTKDGKLTEGCLLELQPIIGDLDELMDRCGRVSELERKNCKPPSSSTSDNGERMAG